MRPPEVGGNCEEQIARDPALTELPAMDPSRARLQNKWALALSKVSCKEQGDMYQQVRS